MLGEEREGERRGKREDEAGQGKAKRKWYFKKRIRTKDTEMYSLGKIIG